MSHNYRLSGWIWVHLNKPFTLIHTLDYMNNQSGILAVRRHWLETCNDVIFSAFMLLRWISIETTQKWLLLLCLSDVGFRRPIKKGPIVYSTSLKYNKFVVNLCEIVFCLLKKTTSTYRIGNDIFMHAKGEFVYLMFVYVSCHETKAQQSNQTTWHGQLLKSIITSNWCCKL